MAFSYEEQKLMFLPPAAASDDLTAESLYGW